MVQRNVLIDIARGIGVVAVMLGHNRALAGEHGELFRIVFFFHMPLFFFF
jgi:fucose 4-O-acetylase-like acetyltransferase